MNSKLATKPVVHYRPTPDDYIHVGRGAYVFPIDHTNHVLGQAVSNTTMVHTSTVLSYDAATGSFETRNTIYVPEGK